MAALAVCGLLGGCAKTKVKAAPDIAASRITQIGVNSYLLRSALDTLSLMAMLQVDS